MLSVGGAIAAVECRGRRGWNGGGCGEVVDAATYLNVLSGRVSALNDRALVDLVAHENQFVVQLRWNVKSNS